jgi:hypothetical protein
MNCSHTINISVGSVVKKIHERKFIFRPTLRSWIDIQAKRKTPQSRSTCDYNFLLQRTRPDYRVSPLTVPFLNMAVWGYFHHIAIIWCFHFPVREYCFSGDVPWNITFRKLDVQWRHISLLHSRTECTVLSRSYRVLCQLLSPCHWLFYR